MADGTDLRTGGEDTCWRFANATFDERDWILTVAGERMTVEHKPLAVLKALLHEEGRLVSKEQLLDSAWPGVTVVDESLATAVRKLRRALGDHDPDHMVIETVRGLGYRIAVPVARGSLPAAPALPADSAAAPSPETTAPEAIMAPPRRAWFAPGNIAAAASIALLSILATLLVTRAGPAPAADTLNAGTPAARHMVTQADARRALQALDEPLIRSYLAAGWNPNASFDDQGNGALNIVLGVCEWDPSHDRRKLMMVARTLLDGGAKLDAHNYWGDTAYSIASAPRYCGPSHPVTVLLRTLCYNSFDAPRDKCLFQAPNRPPK